MFRYVLEYFRDSRTIWSIKRIGAENIKLKLIFTHGVGRHPSEVNKSDEFDEVLKTYKFNPEVFSIHKKPPNMF